MWVDALDDWIMPNPLLGIEVVSPVKPSEENYDRNYVEKPKSIQLERWSWC